MELAKTFVAASPYAPPEIATVPKSGFTDVADSSPYAAAVAWAVERGVTNSTGSGGFSPAQICTRGQIVTFLYRNLAK